MKITPEIKAIQNAYMQARSENNTPEMSRLKAKAMALMNSSGTDEKHERARILKNDGDSKVTKNEDGDLLEISSIKTNL